MNRQYLLQALNLAEKRRGFCAPNPSVGALIVKDNNIIAEGFHWAAGYPHAEVEALKRIDFNAKGSTLYVTLEPCSHFGKTPPCVDAIIRSGIQQVYFGFKDPNPIVAGSGQAKLLAAGIHCELISLTEIETFYRAYAFWWQHQQPWINMKLAVSQDNGIAGKNGEPVQITGAECQSLTHHWRQRCDALLTTAKTIIKDDPQLNVRLSHEPLAKPIYVLDSQCRLPTSAQLFKTAKSITIFHATHANPQNMQKLREQGVHMIEVAKDENGLNLREILVHIGRDGIHELWIEAGAQCFHSFIKQRLVNQLLLYRSAKQLGQDALSISVDLLNEYTQEMSLVNYQQLGSDQVFTYTRKEGRVES